MNVFFRLTAFCAAVFVITIFALVAIVFSDPQAPPVQFLNEHGGKLLVYEMIATIILGVLAMAIDRLQIVRDRADAEAGPLADQLAEHRDP